MRVALTGTPGTGKSAVATFLQNQGYNIVRVYDLAVQKGCVDGVDKKRNTKLIDIIKLNAYIKRHYVINDLVFFEGHIAHLLKAMEKIIILRCHPQVLRKRLVKKKWSVKKVEENIDAETIDVILCETAERYPKENIFEIDTTNKTIEEVARIIIVLAKKKFQPTKTYSIGQIDWSEEILHSSLCRRRYGTG
jgi:adenylate kinase